MEYALTILWKEKKNKESMWYLFMLRKNQNYYVIDIYLVRTKNREQYIFTYIQIYKKKPQVMIVDIFS